MCYYIGKVSRGELSDFRVFFRGSEKKTFENIQELDNDSCFKVSLIIVLVLKIVNLGKRILICT